MTITPTIDPAVAGGPAPAAPGLGTLHTERGNLPLASLTLRARLTGLIGHTELVQGFHNPYDQPLEATYVFPLPDRAAVTGMRMVAGDREIEARLAERAEARAGYDRAVAEGRRAAIAEEERPDVFTMRVGNILPGEEVTVTLNLAGPLSYEDGEAGYRFPLVVAPRYIPGSPLPDAPVGDGYAPDTDVVPDASRITPPVLLPGFPNPVRLTIEVTVDPGGLPLTGARASLPLEETGDGWRVAPGQRVDRDFVLRLRYGDGALSDAAPANAVHSGHSLAVSPDGDGEEGTFLLTVLPPEGAAVPRPRDVVLVLDRSGSMRGWKMTAARRAAARIVDTLTTADRFAVLTFDTRVERPPALPEGLAAATDQHRFQAVTHLAEVGARGGTELLTPLREALSLLDAGGESEREQVLVLVTDGQVGNEDQILADTTGRWYGVRVHTIGIDRAVNAGFLGRLAAVGGGRCELVESEDRLDEAAERIHRRIGAPLVTDVRCEPDGLDVVPDTLAPARVPDLFPGVPLVLTGRYRGALAGALRITGTAADGSTWSALAAATAVESPALAPMWARGHLRDLEDRYAAAGRAEVGALERRIVATSLRFSVLCRFTAYLAVDPRTVTDGAAPHRVIQPVELPAGWEPFAGPAPGAAVPDAAESTVLHAAGPAVMRSTALPRLALRRPGRAAGAAPGGPRTRQGRETQAVPLATTLAAEAARLGDAAGAPEPERRTLLADLVSRLAALLATEQAGDAHLADLRALLEELREDAALRLPAEALTRAWERMRELLERLAGPADPGTTPSPRTAFWKRA